jgi:hypothetical protein
MIQSEWLKNKTGVLESPSQNSPNLGLSLNLKTIVISGG